MKEPYYTKTTTIGLRISKADKQLMIKKANKRRETLSQMIRNIILN